MTPLEFKNEFLLEYDSHASNRAPGMNDYMISYWLTRSENELVKDYLTPKSNRRQEGFEQTETRRAKLSHLVRSVAFGQGDWETYNADTHFSPNSKVFDLTSERVLEIKQEHIEVDPMACGGKSRIKVVPVTHDEANDNYENPFRKPNNWFAWRLDVGDPISGSPAQSKYVELITNATFLLYKLRVVTRPFPIIVGDLTNVSPNLTIDGETQIRSCELDEQLHPEIISRAVSRALENISNPRFQSHAAMDQMQIE